jgi:inhibitor of the pro-sigma K processing machinery
MKNFAALFFPALMLCGLLRIIALPIRWFWKLSINSVCGFLCLWLLNSVATFTNLYFPINAVTVIVAGFLGLPGISALALAQLLL